MGRKIFIKRKKNTVNPEITRSENLEKNIAYFRANPHRLITDWLQLELHDFQNFLIYSMMNKSNYIYIASRGGAKSTVALLLAICLAILYPSTVIVIVTPVKKQAGRFIEKIKEFYANSENLRREIDFSSIKIGENENSVTFHNTSKIVAAVHSENSLGLRSNVIIVDEYVRCDEAILNRVFLPFLTNTRKPPYKNLTKEEKKELPIEANRQIYLSSIRHSEEWSYKKFEKYIYKMSSKDTDYFTLSLPYHFGYRAGFINKKFIEQYIEDNKDETPELIAAELLGIPERGTGTGFFKYEMFKKNRKLEDCLITMTNLEYLTYKENKEEWEYFTPKEDEEIRILSMDIAAGGLKRSDNTIFWITRLFPNKTRTRLRVKLAYGEGINGENLVLQTLRAKQIFYEMNCDYFVVDTGGVGVSVSDMCMQETKDDNRGLTYPSWKFYNEDGAKNNERCLDSNAVACMYAIVPSLQFNHKMHINTKKYLDNNYVELPVEFNDGIEYLVTKKNYYKITDESVRKRLMATYVQTNLLISESINLEQSTGGSQGLIKLENKSTKRKDRYSSFGYNLHMCEVLNSEFILTNKKEQYSPWDYIVCG